MNIEDIIVKKDEANKLTQVGKYEEAELAYKGIIDKITLIPSDQLNKEMITQKTLILSNLSFVLTKQKKTRESLECDKIIIKKLDKSFAKSYARMINSYLLLNNFNLARYHYDLMKQYVSKEEISKIPEITSKIEAEIYQKDAMFLQMREVLMGSK